MNYAFGIFVAFIMAINGITVSPWLCGAYVSACFIVNYHFDKMSKIKNRGA